MRALPPGNRNAMDPVDVLLLKQETDPRRRTTITVALQLAAVPEWKRLQERVEQATRVAPRLRHKVVSPLIPLGLPVWVDDADFDLRYHLRRARLSRPAGAAEVLEHAEEFAIDSLDPARPLWQAVLLDADGPQGATLLVKVSHALMDGLSGIELLAAFIDLEPEPTRDDRDDAPGAPALTAFELTTERLITLPRQTQAQYLRNTVGLVRSSGSFLRHPRSSTTEALGYAGSLRRLFGQRSSAGSQLMSGRSSKRRLVTVEVPHDELKAAGRSAGGSLNDAYLAGVLGAVRRYHEALDSPIDVIPFAIPVSTRAPRGGRPGAEAGNRFAPVRFDAPVGLTDPAERIRRIHGVVVAARAEPALDAMTTVAPALVQMPALALSLAGRAQDRLDVQSSNVPGPPFEIYLAGSRVVRLFAFGPLPGPAIMSVLVSYAGTCCIGFTLDTAAVTDVALFEVCAQAGFDEVLALAADGGASVVSHHELRQPPAP